MRRLSALKPARSVPVRKRAGSFRVSAVSLAVLTAAPVLHAQNGVLEEVLVSARKVEESLQTTPVAVTAMTGPALEMAQVTDVMDIQRIAPNLAISSKGPNNGSLTFVSIRGQTGLAGTLTSDPAIGIYVDGVYTGRPGGSLVDLIDARRVEVLRGPQGTLFGRNTTGGALNILSNEPGNELEGSVKTRFGNYDLAEITGILNVPLTDQLAARLVYQHSERDGYGDNDFQGHNDLDARDSDFYRVMFKYTAPSDRWDVLVSFDQTDREDDGQLTVLTGVNPAPFPATGTPLAPSYVGLASPGDSLTNYLSGNNDFWTAYGNEDDFSQLRTRGVSVVVNADLGWADLKSISAWRDLESVGINDSDGTPYRLLSTGYENDQHQVSQELQLSGGGERLSWIGGLYYFEEKASEITNSTNFVTSLFGYLGSGFAGSLDDYEVLTENNADATNTSYAAYGQLYFDLTDRIQLSAGLRHTRDNREVLLNNLTMVGPPPVCSPDNLAPDGTCGLEREVDFDYWSYMLGLDWQATDNVFVYAKTSRAFLSGGWNNRNGATPFFEPERVRDFEVGSKMDWLQGRLRTNIAAFYAEQDEVQRTVNAVLASGQPSQFITNAGSATVRGLELELTALPWEGMTLTANVGLLDAEYDEFTEVRVVNGAPVTVDRSGEEFRQTPDLTYAISATQRIPLAIGEVAIRVDYSYIDEQTFSTETPRPNATPAERRAIAEANELGVVDSYGLLNAQVALELQDAGVRLAVWGRNLTEEEYHARTFADLYSGPFGYAWAYPGEPRTFGVSASYEF